MIFAGHREDVPQLMIDAFDLLILPSLHEGLPLVVIEAQAAGMQALVSFGVPEEAQVIPGLVSRLSLDAPLQDWVREVQRMKMSPPLSRMKALQFMEKGQFNLLRQVDELAKIYRGV